MLFIINFKAYKTGKEALKLARKCAGSKSNIAIAVQHADIQKISSEIKIPVLAQHVDVIEKGAHTGWILPESIKAAGAIGSLINHSEHQITLKKIEQTIKRLRELGLKSIVCTDTAQNAKKIAKYKPDMIAIEPPELIGGKISISDAHPELITKTIKAVKIPVICGAGIHTKHDVKKAKELGAKGVLIASGITNAKNPKKELEILTKI